jgi:DNA-binding transcriptional LysR family regulator
MDSDRESVESFTTPVSALRGHPKHLVRGRLIDNDLLHVFLTVALCGGFTSAAQALHRTQAAVSLQVKRLEEIVQARLLRRSSRGIELTPKGEILYVYAQKMLAINEEAMLRLHSQEIAGPVRIGAYHHFATAVLPDILAEFAQLYPKVWVELHVGLAMTMPNHLGGEFDIVVGLEDRAMSNAVTLKRENVSWYTSCAHAQHLREPIPIAVLADGSLFRRWAIDSLSGQGRAWHIALVCTSAPAIEAAVAAGLALGVLKEGTVNSRLIRPIGAPEEFPTLPPVNITIQTSPEYCSIASQRLRDFIIYKVRGDTPLAARLDRTAIKNEGGCS